MSFKLTILGCGSAIPTLTSNPTSQLLNVNERFFLIDCGEGTQVQLRKYGINFQRINHIFISHLHGDHYFGLIGLISSMHLLGRNKELHIYAHEELKTIIDLQLKHSNLELKFPLFFHIIPKDVDSIILDNDYVSVESILLDHTLTCSGFIFREKKSTRSIKKNIISKLSIPLDKVKGIKQGADWIDNNGDVVKNSFLTNKNRLPYSYAFCTDTRYNNNIEKKLTEIDLLYYEATFAKNMVDRANATGHSTTFQAATVALNASVRKLIIGHFSKRYKDLDSLLIEAQEYFQNTIIAFSGLEIDFDKIRD
tara:strand:- start:249 stop:1175 length:927 start_codon:yes stop_codon:yes gene_type:complete